MDLWTEAGGCNRTAIGSAGGKSVQKGIQQEHRVEMAGMLVSLGRPQAGASRRRRGEEVR